MIDAEDVQREVDCFGWFHSIDLGNGVRTKGEALSSIPEDFLPDVRGRSVLDIGAWDGKYSFLAERLGASRVVAMDHYVWGVDVPARDRYWNECRERRVHPDMDRDLTDFWRPDLPGQRGFNLAKKVLGSSVEAVVADFMTTDLTALGTFDVVFFFGVLYHVKEPLTALERVRALTKEVTVIETLATDIPDDQDEALMRFLRDGEYASDIRFSSWFVPSLTALKGLCQAAGYSHVEVVQGPPIRHNKPPATLSIPERLKVLRSGQRPPDLPRQFTNDYRAVLCAYV